jgi:hypothetical protein
LPTLPDIFKGCKIFPIAAGTKDPIGGSNGWKDASSDPAQLAEWERDYPGCNWAVAMGPSGLFGFDIDPNGIAAWEALVAADPAIKSAMDKAFKVRSPKGGYHVYFRGEGPSTASRITKGVDTRGGIRQDDGSIASGGYLLLPGSRTVAGPGRVDGEYTVMHLGDIAEMPEHVRAIVPERKKGQAHGLDKPLEPDNPRNVQWCRDLIESYIANGRVSVQGEGGNNLAFAVVASIMDKGISPATAFDLLWEHWNPHCSPPWSDWELEQLVRNAAEYGEETTGAKGFQTNKDAFAGTVAALKDWKPSDGGIDETPVTPERPRGHVMALHDYAASVGDPEWLIKGFLPAQGVAMLYGVSGSYKSFLALDWALSLAYGEPGQWQAAPTKHDVLFIAGEGPVATAKVRWPAWRSWRGIEFVNDHRFFILDRVPAFTDTERWQDVKADLAHLNVKPALTVIDTTSRLLTGLDENSSKDATMVVSFAESIAREYEGLVLLIHHTGKDEKKGARGSSVFHANVDSLLLTTKKHGGMELRVKKHKDADAPDEAFAFKLKESGGSIVLERTEALAEAPKAGKSRHDWASREEVAAILADCEHPQSTAMLAQLICEANTGLQPDVVRRKLNNNKDLDWLKRGDGSWGLPKVEYDL